MRQDGAPQHAVAAQSIHDGNGCHADALRASPPLAVPHRVIDGDVAGVSGTGTPVTVGSGSRDGTGGAFDSAFAYCY